MKSFLILGLGRFGTSIATTLEKSGHNVLGVDSRPEIIHELSDQLTHVIQADAASEEFLRTVGVKNYDAAIVAIGDDLQSSIIATLILKELGASYVVGKAQNALHAKLLTKVGADKVVFPERDMGVREANSLTSNSIVDVIELSADYSIIEICIPTSWIGKTIGELAIRKNYGVNIIALRKGSNIDIMPQSNTIFKAKEIIDVMGKNSDLANLRRIK